MAFKVHRKATREGEWEATGFQVPETNERWDCKTICVPYCMSYMYFYDISLLHLSVVSREIKHKNEECSWVYAFFQGCVAIAWIDANLRYFLWQLELIAPPSTSGLGATRAIGINCTSIHFWPWNNQKN